MASELVGQCLFLLHPWAALAVHLHPVRHSQFLAALDNLQCQQVLPDDKQQSVARKDCLPFTIFITTKAKFLVVNSP